MCRTRNIRDIQYVLLYRTVCLLISVGGDQAGTVDWSKTIIM